MANIRTHGESRGRLMGTQATSTRGLLIVVRQTTSGATAMGWLTTPQRLLKPGRVRVVFFCVAILAFFVTEFGRFVYRPYARRQGIVDFGLADSIGNLGGIIVQIFITLAAVNATKKQSFRIAPLLAVGYVVYEFLQPLLPRGVFDWKDVYGTILGLCVSLAVLWVIWRLFPEMPDDADSCETR